PKPLSQVAENITIITAKEIENMNAHTLTDVLNTIPGVQMDIRGGPGSEAGAYIQGAEFSYVLVMIDGVALNNLSDNFADVSAVPVQNIEQIEIIKGPASSSWGSSLGGVINIITKPVEEAKNTGRSLASYGERNTGDYRAEASGSVNNLGYYIYAGNLATDGLRPNTNFHENNLYTKLKWDINNKTDIIFTFGYNNGSRGKGEDPEFDRSWSNDFEYLFSMLSLNHSITYAADLILSFRTSRQNTESFLNQLSTGDELGTIASDDKGNGGSAKLTWKHETHYIVFGADYDNGELESNGITGGRQRLE
ncbi:MAG: TonB-dependent receptor, partial [Thermodesulfovibrionia bacterium]|nr:TonB-dependent receptor [Thermodesulfovibrionia bacterium]